jgi:hypothetical protein
MVSPFTHNRGTAAINIGLVVAGSMSKRSSSFIASSFTSAVSITSERNTASGKPGMDVCNSSSRFNLPIGNFMVGFLLAESSLGVVTQLLLVPNCADHAAEILSGLPTGMRVRSTLLLSRKVTSFVTTRVMGMVSVANAKLFAAMGICVVSTTGTVSTTFKYCKK